MASGFTLDGGDLRRSIAEFDLKVHGAVSLAVDYHASSGEADMKIHAPWTDRTTAARNGLHSSTIHEINSWTLVFAHAVNYGIWLETRKDFHGRYEIIMPTILAAGDALMRTLDGLFRKV